MALCSFAIVYVFDRKVIGNLMDTRKEKVSKEAVKSVLFTCLPLAIVAFLNNLSLTIPKIFLERYYGEKIFGIYGSVSSPTIVVQLAATTLFAPLVPILTKHFLENKKKDLLIILGKFFALILGGTLLALILSKFFAAWALVLLYGEVIAP